MAIVERLLTHVLIEKVYRVLFDLFIIYLVFVYFSDDRDTYFIDYSPLLTLFVSKMYPPGSLVAPNP